MAVRCVIAIAKDGDLAIEQIDKLTSLISINPIFQSAKCLVCVDHTNEVTKLGDRGFAIGHLFDRQEPRGPIHEVDTTTAWKTIQGNGAGLGRRYWGSYVGIVEHEDGLAYSIVKSPFGSLPCFYTTHENTIIFASDLSLFIETGWLEPRVNWLWMGSHLASGGLPLQSTCLTNISELLGGRYMEVGRGKAVITPWWSPWNFTTPRLRSASQDLASELELTINACVAEWASAFKQPLLGVSGGLDSSIIAAALKEARSPFLAFTMATMDAMGDEREHARNLSAALEIDLIEAFHCHNQIDITQSASCHRPRPGVPAYGQSNLAIQKGLAKSRGADALFSGVGGDNIFCLMQSATPFLDRFQAEGFSPGLMSTLNDIADMTGASVFDILRMSFETMTKRSVAYHWPTCDTFLSEETFQTVEPTLSHSWLAAPAGAMRGKAVHIARLISLQLDTDVFPRNQYGPLVYPLLSEPIVELCLSIPTWRWCERGQNRSVARQAFAKRLPVSIIQRRSKGGPDTFACEVVERNKALIRELLVDGQLVKQGVLDRAAILDALSEDAAIAAKDHLRISALAEAEVWTSSWC